MSFSSRKKQNEGIIKQLDEKYKEASSWLPFSALEINEVFSPEELAELEKFIEDMDSAANDNERTAKLSDNIQEYGKTVLKILKLAKVL